MYLAVTAKSNWVIYMVVLNSSIHTVMYENLKNKKNLRFAGTYDSAKITYGTVIVHLGSGNGSDSLSNWIYPCAHLEISSNQQNRNPHNPIAQPCRTPQCRPHHTC